MLSPAIVQFKSYYSPPRALNIIITVHHYNKLQQQPITAQSGDPLDQSEPSVDNNKDISAVKPDGNISNCILTTYDDTLMSRVNIKPIAKYFSDGDKK